MTIFKRSACFDDRLIDLLYHLNGNGEDTDALVDGATVEEPYKKLNGLA